MLDTWRRAGITQGQTVIDIACGPGYAALEPAETIGAAGKVMAVERSTRFLARLSESARSHSLFNMTTIEAGISETLSSQPGCIGPVDHGTSDRQPQRPQRCSDRPWPPNGHSPGPGIDRKPLLI